MKKIFTLVSGVMMALMMNAQGIVYSPTSDALMNPLALAVENVSADQHYVVGLNTESNVPAIWNVTDNSFQEVYADVRPMYVNYTYGTMLVWEYVYLTDENGLPILDENYMPTIIDSIQVEVEDYGNILSADTIWGDPEPGEGTFHAVLNNGLAVGEYGAQGNRKAFLWHLGDAEPTYLASVGHEASAAYSITADASVIAGFYYLDMMTVNPCIWTNNGTVRTDLPIPTEAECGFKLDYAQARWISEDGNVILGNAQDAYSGSYVVVVWKRSTRSTTSSYVVDCSAALAYYQQSPYDENYEYLAIDNPKRFGYMEATALSADGQWVALAVKDWAIPFSDADFNNVQTVARMNLQTGAIEVMEGKDDTTFDMQLYSIASNGTAVGRLGLDPYGSLAKAVFWSAGNSTMGYLGGLFPAGVAEEGSTGASWISADGMTIAGSIEYQTTDGEFTMQGFLAPMTIVTGCENVIAQPVVEGIYDLMGRRYAEMPATNGVYIVNGIKVIK